MKYIRKLAILPPPLAVVQDMLTFEGDDSVAVLNVEALVTRAVYIHTHSRIRELAKQLKANTLLFDAPDEDIRVVEGVEGKLLGRVGGGRLFFLGAV